MNKLFEDSQKQTAFNAKSSKPIFYQIHSDQDAPIVSQLQKEPIVDFYDKQWALNNSNEEPYMVVKQPVIDLTDENCEVLNSRLIIAIEKQKISDKHYIKGKTHSYQKEGENIITLVNEASLINKIQNCTPTKIIKKVNSKNSSSSSSSSSNSSSSSSSSSKSKSKQKQQRKEQFKQKPIQRYFTKTQSQFCRRCQSSNHTERFCNRAFFVNCRNCLGKHPTQECFEPCYNCCKFGHFSNKCNDDMKPCSHCQRRGHEAKQCGIIKVDKIFNKIDREFLICLACQKSGHFNCSSKEEDRIYRNLPHRKTSHSRESKSHERSKQQEFQYRRKQQLYKRKY